MAEQTLKLDQIPLAELRTDLVNLLRTQNKDLIPSESQNMTEKDYKVTLLVTQLAFLGLAPDDLFKTRQAVLNRQKNNKQSHLDNNENKARIINITNQLIDLGTDFLDFDNALRRIGINAASLNR